MTEFINHPEWGEILNFDHLRANMPDSYDSVYPDFNVLAALHVGSRTYGTDPSGLVAGGASLIGFMMMLAAGEEELAQRVKESVFSLGWTEEHTGSDLLSIQTSATLDPDVEGGRTYHIKGKKWMINNSFHADYHTVLAKVDPTQRGPRSLSLFLVPRSSCKNWKRLDTRVLQKMVLTEFEIDGPGILCGKLGQGLSLVQQTVMPAKFIPPYLAKVMLNESIEETIKHLSRRVIFEENPINFSNVYRQVYNLTQQAAFLIFLYYRGLALSDSSFLQFHGTMMKSWMLLQSTELLSQNWLVIGAKGFTNEAFSGRDAIDSFILPVFDGHYTLNTLMTFKQTGQYLEADRQESVEERMATLRERLFKALPGRQLYMKSREIRRPDFFDYVSYIHQLNIPVALDPAAVLNATEALLNHLDETGLSSETEYKYKIGTLVFWLEAILAACEMWALFGDDYANIIIQQYNGMVKAYNDIVSEGALQVEFMQPMHELPIPNPDNKTAFLLQLLDIKSRDL
ncbi:MAG: acyl-CoA dehydrogenase family protein [Aggregatilineales bacterium]